MYDYEKFYKKYPVNQHDIKEHHLKTASLIKGKVIDIGCGTGTLSDYYLGDYTGFDISSEAIKKAKEIRRKNAVFIAANFIQLTDFDFSKYDTIVMSEFLEHIDNDEVIFSSIKRNAKPGTRIIISVPNGDRIPCDEHVREFTIPQLRKKFSDLGKIKFYNWDFADRQIFCTIDFKEPNTQEVGLVMIVKNEEKGLEAAILSALDYVDYIKIGVDNLTTDQTYKIAERYADEVVKFDFKDDFAAARNEVQDGVKTDWLLFLDGHEYITKFLYNKTIKNTEIDGFVATVRMENGVEFPNPRLYRNGLKFEGAVHEKQAGINKCFPSGILIQHDRLNNQFKEAAEERKKQRDDQIPRIMGAQLAADPKNTRAAFHLALHEQAQGNYKQALKYQKIYLKYSKVPGERWFIRFNTALMFCVLNKPFRALMAARDAENEENGRWEIKKLRGMIFFAKKRYEKAIQELTTAISPETFNSLYKPWPVDDSGTLNLIGECFFNLGDYFKAGLAFDGAAKNARDKDLKGFLTARANLMREIYRSIINNR
jgi:SAM-dependent methyltransferase